MGFKISMRDVASFGSGILQANEKNTESNLKLRQEELKANRDFIIAQKKDKYAAELEMYKEEKKKAAEIDRLNSNAKDSEMSKDAYATQYLMTTLGTEKYKILATNPERLQEAISSIDTPKNYKFSLNRNMIDKQAQADVSIINNTFADEMKNSKGENVIASKVRDLIGMKNQATQDIQTNLEEKLKAAKLVEESVVEQPDLSGIKFKEGRAYQAIPPAEYQKAFTNAQKEAKFGGLTKGDNLVDIIRVSKTIGFDKEKNWKFNKQDNTITGLDTASTYFVSSYEAAYDSIVMENNATDIYNRVTKKQADLVNLIDKTKVNKQVSSIFRDRANIIKSDEVGSVFSKELVTILPLNVVGKDNTMVYKGKLHTINIQESKPLYEKFLNEEALSRYKNTNLTSLHNIQASLQDGEQAYVDRLKETLLPKINKNEVPPKVDVLPKTSGLPEAGGLPKSKIVVTKDGLLVNDKLLNWKKIEAQNRTDNLTPTGKKAYAKWKNSSEVIPKPDRKNTLDNGILKGFQLGK